MEIPEAIRDTHVNPDPITASTTITKREVKMIRLCDLELVDRKPVMVEEKRYDIEDSFSDPSVIARTINDCVHLFQKADEHLYLMCMDSRCQCTSMFELSHGTVRGTSCGMRELFMRALMAGAVSIVLAHNHPSGCLVPSEEDKDICKRTRELGQLFSIELLDFLIVGGGPYDFFSFRDENLM